MDNQHKLVKGYRDLSQQEIDAMNSIKLAEQDIGQLWQQIAKVPGVDVRMLNIAKTQLQQSFSWFVRAVAQPVDVYELQLPDPESETFLTRLCAERDRTVEDLGKLNAFLGSGAVSKLSLEALSDLKHQSDVMTRLAFILSKRYDDLTQKDGE